MADSTEARIATLTAALRVAEMQVSNYEQMVLARIYAVTGKKSSALHDDIVRALATIRAALTPSPRETGK